MKVALVVALAACSSSREVAYQPCDAKVRALGIKLAEGRARDLVGTTFAFANCRLSTASDDDITFTTREGEPTDIRCKMTPSTAKAAWAAARKVKGNEILIDVRATIRTLDDGRILPADCKVRVHE